MARYARPLGLLLGIAALTVALCTLAGRAFPALESGTAYAPEHGVVCTLEGFRRDEATGLWRFELRAEEGSGPLVLLSGRSGIVVRGHRPLEAMSAPQFFRLDLPEAAETTLFFEEPFTPENTRLYVADRDRADLVLTVYILVFAFGMGLTFLMTVHGFSLFRRKRSEGYLAWFAAFTCSIFLWSLCSLPPRMGTSLPFSLVYDLSAVLSAVICFRICDAAVGKWLSALAGRPGVAALMVLFLGAEVLLPSPWPDVLRTAVYALGAAGLIRAVGLKRRGAWFLLAGYAVSFGLRLGMLSGILSLTHINFLLLALRYSKTFNLPFAFCCFFFIDRRFADKFTEAEALAAELAQANATLDAKVAERTQALVRQQEQRRGLMTNIFHDLRTPLFILRGCAEDLERTPEQLPQLLPVMEDRLRFVGSLTEDLFLLAKLEDGKVILDVDRVDLGPLLARVAAACRVEGERKGVEVCFRSEADCTVWGDELRLEQIVQNLAVNGVHYTREGGTVELSLAREGERAVVRVKDNGVGVAPEDLSKLFDRYYRAAGTDKRGSTGLGLSIAQELARLHRGSITAESTPGVGTVFSLTLPAV